MKRILELLLTLLMLAGVSAHAEEAIASLTQLNAPGMTIGVDQGSAAELTARKEFPNAKIEYFNDKPSAYLAVAQGKIDAFVYDYNQMRIAIENGVSGVHLLDESLGEPVRIAVGISPATKIPDLVGRLNQFISEARTAGTLDDMFKRWVVDGDTVVPDIPVPEGADIHLTVGTSGIVAPFSYYAGSRLTGFDIELAYRFAAWLGADVRFKVYDYGAIIPACATGDVDCVMANLNITPERAEALPFSDVLYEERIGVMVRGSAPTQSGGTGGGLAWLNGARIGVQTGTSFDGMVEESLPDAQIEYYNNKADLVTALTGHKIDAIVFDEPVAQLLMRENDQVTYLEEYLDSYEFAVVFPRSEAGEALRDRFNAFLEQLPDGTLDALAEKWFGEDEDAKTMPDIAALSAENGTLRLATESGYAPFEYIRNGEVVGYDMELAALFCAYSGFGLEIVDMNFDGILPAVQTGKADFAAAGISITPERAESVLFSEPNFSGNTMMVVLKGDGNAASAVPADFNGRSAGVITGSFHDSVIAESLPDSPISQYNNYSDMIAALETRKIDFFLASAETTGSILEANDDLQALPEPIRVLDIGAMFARSAKGEVLKAQMDDFIARSKADGTLDEIYAFWSNPDNESVPVDMSDLTGENGTLRFATSGTKAPVSFVANGSIAGTDPDIAVRFCREYGYGIEVSIVDTAGIIPGIATGMYDFSLSDMVITEERKESVLFSEPYHGTELLVVTRGEETQAKTKEAGFWSGVASSFDKTFLREDRWRLFGEGVMTTLLITLLSIVFGTLLGFVIFMLCRNGNPMANHVTRFCLWLVQGMPMVVLLMILYYVVFGSVAISGMTVAIIGFTLTFGAAVYGLLRMGVGAVETGQYEAAYALGYSNQRTFFRIILPQALPHVLPAYKGEIVGLIKATAIVGYIAVQDLTKMGDIVRSRTYEAFFPLIAVTIIYFLLETLIGFLISRVTIRFNPKRRKPDEILKGVKTDDQN